MRATVLKNEREAVGAILQDTSSRSRAQCLVGQKNRTARDDQ